MPSVNVIVFPESLEFELIGKGAYSYQKLVVGSGPDVEIEMMPENRPNNYFQTHVFWVPQRRQWIGFHEVSDEVSCQFLGPYVILELLPPPPEDEVIAKAENTVVYRIVELGLAKDRVSRIMSNIVLFASRYRAQYHVSYYDDSETLTGSEDITIDFNCNNPDRIQQLAEDLIRERIGENDKFTIASIEEI
jgi:hypothetical protein